MSLMPYYRSVGDIPPKRHTQFRQPDGSLYVEELMGEEGFSFDSALLYHRYPPTALQAIEPIEVEAQETTPNHPLRPRHFRTHQLKAGGDVVMALLGADGEHRLLLANMSDEAQDVIVRQTGEAELQLKLAAESVQFLSDED